MGNRAINKMGTDLLLAAAKSFGNAFGGEAGKYPFTKKQNNNRNKSWTDSAIKLTAVCEKEYNRQAIDSNLMYCANYAKKLIPIAGVTFGMYVTLPVLVGATTFATFGATASMTAYTLTNYSVIAGGLYKASEKVLKMNNHRKINQNECMDEANQDEAIHNINEYLEVDNDVV